jgi:transcription factor TFIIIB component B''
LTGKDFSGPTPVIRVPTPVRMVENDHLDAEDENRNSPVIRKQSRTPGIGQSDQNMVEVLGDVDNFEDKDTT